MPETAPTAEQLARLPKWAQEYIEDLERERDYANRAVARLNGEAPKGAFVFRELACPAVGRNRHHEVRIDSDRAECHYAGIDVSLTLAHEGHIAVTFSPSAGIFPRSSNLILLKKVEDSPNA